MGKIKLNSNNMTQEQGDALKTIGGLIIDGLVWLSNRKKNKNNKNNNNNGK